MCTFLVPNTAEAHRFQAATHFEEGLAAVADLVIAAHRVCSLSSQKTGLEISERKGYLQVVFGLQGGETLCLHSEDIKM